MTKDELLTLLEAWEEVEQEAKTQAPEPVKPPRPARPPKRPTKLTTASAGASAAAAAAGASRPAAPAPGPRPGAPITVRLPAFVPIQLSAMYTQPLTVIPAPALGGGGAGAGAGAAAAAAAAGGGGGGGGNAGAAAAAAGGGGGGGAAAAAAATGAGARVGYGLDSDYTDLEQVEAPHDEGGQRFFRYLQYPMTGAQPHTRSAPPLSPPVMRNTLESVDAGVAPLSTFAKVKSKSTYLRPQGPPPPPSAVSHSGPVVRPR